MDAVERRPPPSDDESYVLVDDGSPFSLADLASIGNDLSFQEAVNHLRETARQNLELRNKLEQNNKIMRSQIQTMQDWKAKWEQDREEVKRNNEQARQVVTQLRADIAKKDAKIEQLSTKIEEMTSERISAPVSDEKRELVELKQQIASLQKQLEGIEEEKNNLTAAKDEVCRELDQHTKIVGNLQTEKQKLEEECKTLKSEGVAFNERMQDLKKKLEALTVEKMELSKQNEKLRNYSMVQETSQSSSVAAGDSQAVDGSESSIGTTISVLFSQLQDLRSQNNELKSAISARNQEVETLQEKVHQGEEQFKQCEHEHRLALNQEQEQHQATMAQLQQEMSRLRKSSRSSSEGSNPSMEEVKSLKSQVVSFGNELKTANAKLRDMEDLYNKQKERMKGMEHKLHAMGEEENVEREKADDLIAKLQDSVRVLETELEQKQIENQRVSAALKEKNVKFSQLFIDYQDSLQKLEEVRTLGGGPEFQALRNKVDELTAQLIAGEESLAARAEQLAKVKQERDAALQEAEKFIQILPVVKAQNEVYKNDFDAERQARERTHQEKEKLAEENEYLYAEISKLKEELQTYSGAQLQLMRNKHAENRQHGNQQRPGCTGTPQGQERARKHMCPICQKEFPDVDSLQLHCMDCGV